MSAEITVLPPRQLTQIGMNNLPAVVTRTGEHASRRFIEFFTANIRNKNTRTDL